VETISMKVAIPSAANTGLSAAVCSGFNGCTYFTIVDLGGNTGLEIILSPGGSAMAFVLAGRGVQAVLAKDISEIERLTIIGMGLRVYAGASGTVQDAVTAFANGKLAEQTDIGHCCN
jgi:predicted Fe-Mo cluster-binding NifX family protein